MNIKKYIFCSLFLVFYRVFLLWTPDNNLNFWLTVFATIFLVFPDFVWPNSAGLFDASTESFFASKIPPFCLFPSNLLVFPDEVNLGTSFRDEPSVG